jgi:hypothetical protein
MSTDAASDHGSLYQLRNILGWTNVGKDPTKDFNACDDFFQAVISAHIVAAFHKLDLGDFDPAVDWMKQDEEREHILLKFSSQIMDKFVDFSFNQQNKNTSKDLVQEYAIRVLSMGCFYLE